MKEIMTDLEKDIMEMNHKIQQALEGSYEFSSDDLEMLHLILGTCNLGPRFTLSRKKMPDFDGMYYVYGFMHHSCGNVTPFHKIVECKMNQWVKSDSGEQMTYWTNLLDPPY